MGKGLNLPEEEFGNYYILKSLKQKKWNRETPQYEMTVNNVRFENLNREQYDLLYKIKANEQ